MPHFLSQFPHFFSHFPAFFSNPGNHIPPPPPGNHAAVGFWRKTWANPTPLLLQLLWMTTLIDLMSFGTRSVAVGDMQLPAYTCISKLAGNVEAPNAKAVGWPKPSSFANCNVDITHFNATDGCRKMLDFVKTFGLHFLSYRCRVMDVHLVQQHRMVRILAHVTKALFLVGVA